MLNEDGLKLIPYPKKLIRKPGMAYLTPEWSICFSSKNKHDLYPIAKRLQNVIKEEASLQIKIVLFDTGPKDMAFVFLYEQKPDKESYSIITS